MLARLRRGAEHVALRASELTRGAMKPVGLCCGEVRRCTITWALGYGTFESSLVAERRLFMEYASLVRLDLRDPSTILD